MVTTHKAMIQQKKIKIYVKEDNPARKFMSHDEAVADNARLKAEREKIAAYTETLKKEREVVKPIAPPIAPPTGDDSNTNANVAEIAKLEDKLSKQKGPGSKARKEKIQAEIDALKKGV